MALSKEARDLLNAAAYADRAPLRARHQGRKRLVGALASGTLTTSAIVAKGASLGASTVVSTVGAGSINSLAVTLVSAVAIGFSAGLLALSPTTNVVQKSVPHASALPKTELAPARVIEAKPPPVFASPEPSSQLPHHESAPAVITPAKPIKASIARETELLAMAQRALAAGRPGSALEALDRYAEECPTGRLYEEAIASRVVALCALGRVQDGKRWAEEFYRHYPNSPLMPRVRGACPAAPTAPNGTALD